MESTDYSPSSFAASEHEAQPEPERPWGQQNGVHLTESGLPSMAYDMPSVLGHEEAATSTPVQPGPTDRTREYAQQLAATLTELGRSLDDTEAERARAAEERDRLQARIQELQTHQATLEKVQDTMKRGSAGSVTSEDLDTFRGMMDALSQDPDRLTVLFTVVQQASKLAAVVNDYVALRRMVENS